LFYNIFLIILLSFSFIFQSKLEDAIASHSEELDKNSTPDDIFSQVFGKDRHGYVRTYGKGVVPSDLWGSKSQVEMRKLINEVQRNAQVELQSIKEKMQEEMEARLKEQVEAHESWTFTQLQVCFYSIARLFRSNASRLGNIQDVKEEIVIEVYSIILH